MVEFVIGLKECRCLCPALHIGFKHVSADCPLDTAVDTFCPFHVFFFFCFLFVFTVLEICWSLFVKRTISNSSTMTYENEKISCLQLICCFCTSFDALSVSLARTNCLPFYIVFLVRSKLIQCVKSQLIVDSSKEEWMSWMSSKQLIQVVMGISSSIVHFWKCLLIWFLVTAALFVFMLHLNQATNEFCTKFSFLLIHCRCRFDLFELIEFGSNGICSSAM